MNALLEIIRAVQTFLGLKADGDPRELTWRAIYKAVTGKVWADPAPVPVPVIAGLEDFPHAAVSLILEAEGIDQPGKHPGGGSGITLGYGCDIGADPGSLKFWEPYLTAEEMRRLAFAQGKTGRRAAEIQTRFADIHVTREASMRVFMEESLPVEIKRTRETFKGIEVLPSGVLGACVSLVYNRGTDLDRDEGQGDRRLEMRQIADAILAYSQRPSTQLTDESILNETLEKIAALFRRMKRIWRGTGQDGLLTRRDAEADLILKARIPTA